MPNWIIQKPLRKGGILDLKSEKSKVGTSLIEYRCPKCAKYNPPEIIRKTGIAVMRCRECKAEYYTNTKVTMNFRKFSSKVASHENKSPSYYSGPEKRVKKYFEGSGLIEGIDFFHNVRIKKGDNHIWVDYMLPFFKSIVEVDPSVWHKIGNRENSDTEKYAFLQSMNFNVISLNDKDLKNLDEKLFFIRKT